MDTTPAAHDFQSLYNLPSGGQFDPLLGQAKRILVPVSYVRRSVPHTFAKLINYSLHQFYRITDLEYFV